MVVLDTVTIDRRHSRGVSYWSVASCTPRPSRGLARRTMGGIIEGGRNPMGSGVGCPWDEVGHACFIFRNYGSVSRHHLLWPHLRWRTISPPRDSRLLFRRKYTRLGNSGFNRTSLISTNCTASFTTLNCVSFPTTERTLRRDRGKSCW